MPTSTLRESAGGSRKSTRIRPALDTEVSTPWASGPRRCLTASSPPDRESARRRVPTPPGGAPAACRARLCHGRWRGGRAGVIHPVSHAQQGFFFIAAALNDGQAIYDRVEERGVGVSGQQHEPVHH